MRKTRNYTRLVCLLIAMALVLSLWIAGVPMAEKAKAGFPDLSTLTLASGEDVGALAVQGNYLYAGLCTSPGEVVKINLANLAEVSTLTLASGENNIVSSAVKGNYLYAGTETSPGKVVKINLANFTEVSTLTLASGDGDVYALVVKGNYLYAGLYITPGTQGKVVKIGLVP